MALLPTAPAVEGLAKGEGDSLKAVLDQLQTATAAVGAAVVAAATKVAVVAGAAAVTNIPIAGILTGDALVGVVQFDLAADTGSSATGNKVQNVVDRTSEASITSNGNIQLSTTVTTGDVLLVIWTDLTP